MIHSDWNGNEKETSKLATYLVNAKEFGKKTSKTSKSVRGGRLLWIMFIAFAIIVLIFFVGAVELMRFF